MTSGRAVFVAALTLALACGLPAAWAGGDMDEHDHANDPDAGPAYHGFVKDTRGVAIPDARVIAEIKNRGTIVTNTNILGAYRLNDFGKDFSVVIGRRLADLLKLKVGDSLQLVSPVEVATPLGVMPRSVQARVAAVFCAGMYDYDANFVYAPLPDVQRLLNYGNMVTGVEVFVADDASLAAARRQLSQIVGTQAWVFDWWQANIGFFAAIQGQTNVMFIVLTMIVLVAAFNIVSTMVMVVKGKRRDIAILRTFGSSPRSVLTVFIVQGSLIGLLGIGVGVLIGVLVAANLQELVHGLESIVGFKFLDARVYFMSDLPARVRWTDVVRICGFAFVLACLSTVYPAVRAARLLPAESLRND